MNAAPCCAAPRNGPLKTAAGGEDLKSPYSATRDESEARQRRCIVRGERSGFRVACGAAAIKVKGR